MYVVYINTRYSCARSFDVRKSWIIKTQLFAFYLFFFFLNGGLVWRKTRQKSEIRNQASGPGPLALATCLGFLPEKKKRQEGCGGFGALRTNKI